MINVTEREQKKVKGLIGSRKAANFYNGQSAANIPLKGEGSTNRGRVSLNVLTFYLLTFTMGKASNMKVTVMESLKGVVYQIKNMKNQ